MKYAKYQQGSSITLDGLKYYLRIVDNSHDTELAGLLKSATLYIQEYFNVPLVECSALQEQPQADTLYTLFLANHENIQVKDWHGNTIAFEINANRLTIAEPTAVKITYDCKPIPDADRLAIIVYQIAAANYDGQSNLIPQILKSYPVAL